MKIKKLTILAVVVLVAGLMAFGVPTAQAATPTCGEVLTRTQSSIPI